MTAPEISVVMGVYNGGPQLRDTLDSILSQAEVSFEFIVVNDGSTDATGSILREYAARDCRLQIIDQNNMGLTSALVRGCAAARGKYIARQDCGDISLPGRLSAQRDVLESEPRAVLVSCGTSFVGPEGDHLYTVAQPSEDLQVGLSAVTLDSVRGPSHHGSTMFRRSAYHRVGGYRPVFRVAQDLDLWMRFAEIDRVLADPTVRYQAKWQPGSISAMRRKDQLVATTQILACATARRQGRNEAALLPAVDTTAASVQMRTAGYLDDARFFYFIAACLRRNAPSRSRYFYKKSLQASKLFLPAWLGLIRASICR